MTAYALRDGDEMILVDSLTGPLRPKGSLDAKAEGAGAPQCSGRVVRRAGGPLSLGPPAQYERLRSSVAALVARLTFVSLLPVALVARLTFIAELPRGLVGKGRAGSGQAEEDAEHEYRNLAFHRRLPS